MRSQRAYLRTCFTWSSTTSVHSRTPLWDTQSSSKRFCFSYIRCSMLLTQAADTEVWNQQYPRYLTLFPGFPLIPGGPGNPCGPCKRKEENKRNGKRCKKCDKKINTMTKKEWYEASSEVKIMFGLTGGPLSPLSPLSPVGPGRPCKIKTRIHQSVPWCTGAIQLFTQI